MEHDLVHRKAAGLISAQGAYIGREFNAWSGCIQEEPTDGYFSFTSMFLPLCPSHWLHFSFPKISEAYPWVRIKSKINKIK